MAEVFRIEQFANVDRFMLAKNQLVELLEDSSGKSQVLVRFDHSSVARYVPAAILHERLFPVAVHRKLEVKHFGPRVARKQPSLIQRLVSLIAGKRLSAVQLARVGLL